MKTTIYDEAVRWLKDEFKTRIPGGFIAATFWDDTRQLVLVDEVFPEQESLWDCIKVWAQLQIEFTNKYHLQLWSLSVPEDD